MAGDWKSASLRKVCKEIYRYPSFYGMEKHKHGVPVIRGEHLLPSGRISTDWSDYWFVSEEYARQYPKTRVTLHDLVMSVRGTIGTFARVGPAHVGAQLSPNVIRLSPDPEQIEPVFFYYAVKGSTASEFIASTSSSSAVPALRASDIKLAEIPIPPAREQRAIAHILGTLDDKIELNQRMSATLESMARALFKSWFVDFDPVRAKIESRDPGLPQPLADLFPDSFEDSELGEIPRGWEVKSIGDLANAAGGTTPSTKNNAYWDGGEHAWATPKDLSALSVPVLLDTERRITDAGLAQIGSGLLAKGTVLLSSRAPIGYLAIAEIPVAVNQGFIAMTPKSGTSNLFLLFWASVAHDEIVSRANGSTFLEISKTNFRPIPIVTPSAEVMRKFEQLARPFYERVVVCARESHKLATLRDALLLKLVSGELRLAQVKDKTP
ncbi:MAG: restriction endonuclease subunit S [Pirellulaceae bacterium]